MNILTGYLMIGMWRLGPVTVVQKLEQNTRYDIHLLGDLLAYSLNGIFPIYI